MYNFTVYLSLSHILAETKAFFRTDAMSKIRGILENFPNFQMLYLKMTLISVIIRAEAKTNFGEGLDKIRANVWTKQLLF